MTVFDSLDFVKGFKLFQADKVDLLKDAVGEKWVTAQSRIACRIIVNEIPQVEARFSDKTIDEETVLYVVSSMVARVALYTRFHAEGNGTYTYTNDSPQQSPPDYTPSANLYLKKSEKALLSPPDAGGPMGTVNMGLSRIWGR